MRNKSQLAGVPDRAGTRSVLDRQRWDPNHFLRKKYNNEEGNTDDGNNNFLRYNAGPNIDPNLGNPRAIINKNLCSKEIYNIDPNSEKNPGAKINKNLGFKEFSNTDPHLVHF